MRGFQRKPSWILRPGQTRAQTQTRTQTQTQAQAQARARVGLWVVDRAAALALPLLLLAAIHLVTVSGAARDAVASPVQGPTELWDRIDVVLESRVDTNGRVRYEGLLGDPAFVTAWQGLLSVRAGELAGWARAEQLAFWINAYNLATLKLIADHYPIEGRFPLDLVLPDNSILMVPGRWKGNFYPLAGRERSLDAIEHEILRKDFDEPRIHFAIVCASIGCPFLRREAYRGAVIETQLEEQAQRYFASPTGLVWDEKEIKLTQILDWFREDFADLSPDSEIERVQSGGDQGRLLARVARWFPPEAVTALRRKRLDTGWIKYDWSLNEQRRPS